MTKQWLILASVSLSTLGVAAPAAAQTGAGTAAEPSRPAAAAADDTGIEDIVVTARRQQEALIDVPVAVTALTSKKLDSLGLQQFKQVGNFAPSLLINGGPDLNSRTGSQIIIRGMVPGTNPTASVFIDGVFVRSGVVEGVDDVARIEVLRGPQTTFFGRSVFAGAINFVTKTPDMENFKGRASADFDNHALVDLRGQVEGPIVRDKLSIRLAGRYYDRQGTRKNVAGGRFGDEQTKLFAGALRFTPTERLSINLYGFIQRDKDGPSTQRLLTAPNYNCNAGANPGGAFNYICGLIPNEGAIPLGANVTQADIASFLPFLNQTVYGTPASPVPRLLKRQPIDEAGLRGRIEHIHGAVEYDADVVTMNVLAGYNRTRHWLLADADFQDSRAIPHPVPIAQRPAGAPNFYNNLIRREDYYMDWFVEGRISTDQSKPFRAVLGASYAYAKPANLVTAQLATGAVITGGLGAVDEAKTKAVFGSVTWDIVPRITLSAEGRYQIDKLTSFRRSSFTSTNGPIAIPGGQLDTRVAGDTFKNFAPRFIAQYKPVAGTMLFGSYSVGINPGRFNTSILAFAQPVQDRLRAATGVGLTVDPEKLYNTELGIKTQFWDNKAQITASLYRAVWKNQIITIAYFDQPTLNTITVSSNVGKTVLKGFELEGVVRPIPILELSGALAYNGSDIKRYVCVSCQPFAGTGVSVIGNSLFRAPRWSASVSAQVTQPVTDGLDAFARSDFFYKGSIYADETNLARTHPQRVWNFRAGIQNPAYRVEAFVTNAFNNRAPISIVRGNDGARGGAVAFQLGYPELRRIGVRFAYNFGS